MHVAFNSATGVISVALSFPASPNLVEFLAGGPPPLQIALAAGVDDVINTLLVSVVVALVDQKVVRDVWPQWFGGVPVLSAGSAIAGVIIACNHSLGWTYSLLLLPVMYAEYFGFRMAIEVNPAGRYPTDQPEPESQDGCLVSRGRASNGARA